MGGVKLLELEKAAELKADEVLKRLGTSENGLTREEAKKRLEIYGSNEVVTEKKTPEIIKFLSNFTEPFILILIFADLLFGFLGDFTNMLLIQIIIFVSVVIDYLLERKAEKTSQFLKQKLTTTTAVIRDGIKKEINIKNVVPGDIVFLSAGDIIPGDGRIISANDLFVNQSSLTGESFPVEKTAQPLDVKGKPLGEWKNCVFMGSSVVSGTAKIVIVSTGKSTEFGKIADKVLNEKIVTDFDVKSRNFGWFLARLSFTLALVVFLITFLTQHKPIESFMFAVALAVGITPELLPIILSLNLSNGAIEMWKKGLIVKKLSVIENLGTMDVLCTDKTGTLTENKIVLVKYIGMNNKKSDKVFVFTYLNSFFQTGIKNPLDDAVLNFSKVDISKYEKVDEIPFDFERKRLTVVVKSNSEKVMITKGSVEAVVKICSKYEVDGKIKKIEEKEVEKIVEPYYEMSKEGFRVIAIAYKKVKGQRTVFSKEDERDMILLGFVAFLDPPKRTARDAVKNLKNIGVDLKILTGDNEFVTKKICELLDIEVKRVVKGEEIRAMSDEALARVVEEANVFVNLTPIQKNRIVNALKSNGHVVGFLGDGINDATPIKTADVGISVNNAVDIAKETADIILTESDLKVINDGVIEGRKTFSNFNKYIKMAVSSNFGNMFSTAVASSFLPFLPMTPSQILLNNLLYDFSQFPIPKDNVDEDEIKRPSKWDINEIKKFMIAFGPISSIFDFLTFFVLLFALKASEAYFRTAWFVESLTTQTLIILSIRTKKTPFYKSRASLLLVLTIFAIVLIGAAMPYTQIGGLFGFTPLGWLFYAILLIFVLAYFGIVEIMKKKFYKS